jgi:hypothetical protein
MSASTDTRVTIGLYGAVLFVRSMPRLYNLRASRESCETAEESEDVSTDEKNIYIVASRC